MVRFPEADPLTLTPRELAARLSDPARREELSANLGTPVVVLEEEPGQDPERPPSDGLTDLPTVLVGVARSRSSAAALADWCDVVVGDESAVSSWVVAGPLGVDEALARILTCVGNHPIESAALVMLLRGSARRATGEGLLAESALYSMLLCAPGFLTWRRESASSNRSVEGTPIELGRNGDLLSIVLSRPAVHNAFNVAMRDALAEALALAEADPQIRRIALSGAGPSFCSGGDLREFGAARDPASAHIIRLTRSIPRLMAALSSRIEATIHGATIGAGIELAAFAGRVVARPNTSIRLPELEMGLIPGSGGTVSLPRRIGRHRTAWLALTGEAIDAARALAWGLVDTVTDID
jgi:hypothetical protein